MRHMPEFLALVGLSVLLAACSPSGDKSSADRDKAPAASEAAKPGEPTGKLTLAVASLGTAEAWLPWLEAGREGWLVLEPIYESLVTSDPTTGDYIPELADRWEVDSDAKTWRFFLHKGVPFQNGQGELTADDVKFSYDKYLSDKSVASNKPLLQQLVAELEVVNPYEVVFHLKRPDVTFLGRLAFGQFGVASKKYVEAVGDAEAALKPVGTGPFRVIDYKRQQSVTFEAVIPHWRHTPGFKTLMLKRVPDQSARLAMLRAGEVDVADVPYKFKREAEAAGFKFLRAQGAALYHVQLGGQLLPSRETFDPSVPWVGDPNDPAAQERALKVRKALNLAVDKQAIIDAVFEGEGVQGVAPYFAPGSPFVPPDVKPYPYDPKEAKRLLTEAGYPQGFSREIEMLVMPWPGRAEMADVDEAVAGFWERNLGLKVKRRPMDFGTYASDVGGPRKTAWVTWTQGYTPRPVSEPIAAMGTWLESGAHYNSAAESKTIDELAAKIKGDADRQSRIKDYQALAREFYEKAYAVPIASVPSLYAYNPKVIGEWPLQPGEAYISGYDYATPPK